MCEHSVAQAALAIEPAEHQSDAAVKKETAEDDHGSESHQHIGGRQMSCRKEDGRHHIGSHQNPRRRQFLLFSKDLV